MKRFAVFALAMLVALFPVIANAEEAAELPAEEVWSATVLRVDLGSLLVRIEAVDPEERGRLPVGRGRERRSPPPRRQPTDAPEAHSLAAEEAQEDDAIGVQLVRIAEDTPVWRRARRSGFEEASAADIAEGDLLTLRVADGTALEIVIEESDPAPARRRAERREKGSDRGDAAGAFCMDFRSSAPAPCPARMTSVPPFMARTSSTLTL